MREILFRGKRIDINGWVEGYYAVSPTDSKSYIYAKDYTEVDIAEDGLHVAYRLMQVIPETVGQYTGLTDKNGKKIFEGDIVKFPHGTKSMNGKIEYIEEDCIYYLTYKTSRVPFGVFFNGFELEIIGNIYENPELLEVVE